MTLISLIKLSFALDHLKMKALLVVGLAIFAVAHGGVINAKCDDQKFQTCTTTFAKDLGLTEMPTDSKVLVSTLIELLKSKGLDGQKEICKGVQDLKTCLGDQYSTCISVTYLQSIGEKVEDAETFVTLAAQENYMCTTGFDVISKNWQCIADVGKKNVDYFAKCQTDYRKNMQQDPKNICKYDQQFVDCHDGPYQKACVADVRNTMCQVMKVGFAAAVPQCSVNC